MDIAILLTDITYRYYFLGAHFIITFVAFQLGMRFFINATPSFKSAAGRLNLVFSELFFCMGSIFIFKIGYFFFATGLFDYEKIVYIIITAGAFVGLLLTETIIRKNYFFTIISVIALIIFIFIPLTSNWYYLGFGLFIIILIYPIQYLQYLITMSGGKAKSKLIQLFISVLLIAIGSSFNVERWLIYYPPELLITGLGLIGLGLAGVYKSILNINLFQESNIETALEDLYVIDPRTYECLYFLNFSKHIESSDPSKLEVFSGGLIGIESMLQTISHSTDHENVRMIEQNNRYFYLEHGDHLLFCIIANQKLQSIPYFLHKIRNQWEPRFGSEKIDWDNFYSASGKVAKQLIYKIFHLKWK